MKSYYIYIGDLDISIAKIKITDENQYGEIN